MKPATRPAVLVAAAMATLLFARNAGAVAAIGISRTAGLGFGQIVATSVAGTVTVTPAGDRSSSGGAARGNSLTVSAASFSVSGEPNTSYSITLPGSVSLATGVNSMTVDTFTCNPSGSGVLGTGGTQAVSVGATLHVGAGQPQGSYSGTYSVTVSYE